MKMPLFLSAFTPSFHVSFLHVAGNSHSFFYSFNNMADIVLVTENTLVNKGDMSTL